MLSFIKRILVALVILALLYALNLVMSEQGLFGFGVPLYQVDLWKMAGINIILAVSLNLINGFTGQFSIGHIGFMAVGAYSSAYFSVNYGANLAATLGNGKLGWVIALGIATIIGAVIAGI